MWRLEINKLKKEIKELKQRYVCLKQKIYTGNSGGPSKTVQSDYTEKDPLEPSYIKNKPNLDLKLDKGGYPGTAKDLKDEIALKLDKESDPLFTQWGKDYNTLNNKPVLFSGDYNDLINKPNTLFSGDYNDLINKPSLFSGSWSDLTNKPTIFPTDWSIISNKPLLFSGNYNDLTNLPTLFSGNYQDLTNKPTTFPPSQHNHDDRYYTENEVDNKINDAVNLLLNNPDLNVNSIAEIVELINGNGDALLTKVSYTENQTLTSEQKKIAQTNIGLWQHNHDDRYYLKNEVINLLNNKSDINHTHSFSQITSKPTTLSGYGITDAFDGNWSSLNNIPPEIFENTQLTESQVDAMVENNGYLKTESDTLQSVTERGAETNKTITTKAIAKTENNVTRIINPTGGFKKFNNNSTIGAIKIELPVGWLSTMISMEIEVYNFAQDESFILRCGGYTYKNGIWMNTFAYSPNSNYKVRFGKLNEKIIILIGEVTTTWKYLAVSINSVQLSYSNYTISNWDDNWNIDIATAIPITIDKVHENIQIGYKDFLPLTANKYLSGWIGRTEHNTGHLVGGYNNVGSSVNNTNPIYTIGSSYNPGEASLDNMYGIGYTTCNAHFLNEVGLGMIPSGGWGMYVAADGDARVLLEASNGHIFNKGNVYSSSFVKRGSNNSYILLGGGGHKPLSDIEERFTNIENYLSRVEQRLIKLELP